MPRGSFTDFSEAWVAGHMAKMGQPIAPLREETPEGTLLAEIRKVARPNGWLGYHTLDSRGSDPGFQDLVLCNGVDLLLWELKTNTGKLTREQALWMAMVKTVTNVEADIRRPRDWPAIVARLTRGRH